MRPKECQSSRVITSLQPTPSHTGMGSYKGKISIKVSIVSFELGSERNNVTHRLETTTQPAVAKEKVEIVKFISGFDWAACLYLSMSRFLFWLLTSSHLSMIILRT